MLAPAVPMGDTRLRQARLLALLLPCALLGGALFSQYVGGLYPCEMCYWQRWPHGAAILLAIGAFVSPARAKPLVLLAALAILISGLIGVETRDSVVRLSGWTRTSGQARHAERDARSVGGVRYVQNEIRPRVGGSV